MIAEGGASAAVANGFGGLRQLALDDLKKEAVESGANAVIAIDLDMGQLTRSDQQIWYLSANGTAVVVVPVPE